MNKQIDVFKRERERERKKNKYVYIKQKKNKKITTILTFLNFCCCFYVLFRKKNLKIYSSRNFLIMFS